MQPQNHSPLSRSEAEALIRFATLAPSGHNTQPWKFTIRDSSICIYPDFSRRLPVVDPDDHALFISLGCALENLVIAAQHRGFSTQVEYFPTTEPDCLVVHLSRIGSTVESSLFHAITDRQSTRAAYDGRKIPQTDLQRLVMAGHQSGVQLCLFTTTSEIEAIIEFVKEGNHRQFSNPPFVNELLSWVRFNQREVECHQDGLTAGAMGLPSLPRWLGKFIMKLFATPQSQAKQVEKLIRSSSALLLFMAEQNDQGHWVNLGRSFERVALTATVLKIKHAHLNMPCEVLEVRSQLQQYLNLKEAQPLLLLRLGYAQPMLRSPRRPLEDVLLSEETRDASMGSHWQL